ncbi:hypothetical protein AA313_de0204532 [Arthrobotrys entomopaga]|nr:hypothetical protein AA313_de0204532 [Arthrobotrys entomopaga]
MFGCGQLWRSGQDKSDTKSLGTLQVFNSRDIREKKRLTSSGMILIALLSGGDYDSAGVARLGMKQAVAAARAGYGEELIKAFKVEGTDDGQAIREWRQRLESSLRTNHEKIFSRRQPSVTIPLTFPDSTIIGYYVNPKISDIPPIINWDIRPNIEQLQEITKKKFEWSGSGKLIRTLSEKLLSWQLGHNAPGVGKLVLDVHQRAMSQGTGMPNKIRITFNPLDTVPVPYNHEVDNVYTRPVQPASEHLLEDEHGYSDSDKEDIRVNGAASTVSIPGKPERLKKEYDPRDSQRAWLYEEFLKLGAGPQVQMWDENEAKKRALKETQAQEKKQRLGVKKQQSQQPKLPQGQKKINFYYAQRKLAPNGTNSAAAIKETSGIPLTATGQKENTPLRTSPPKVGFQVEKAKDELTQVQGALKVVTRESLPGAWKVVHADDEEYDDKAFDDVGVWDLTDVQ